MPNIKSAKKRVLTSAKKCEQNILVDSRMKNSMHDNVAEINIGWIFYCNCKDWIITIGERKEYKNGKDCKFYNWSH